MEDKKIRKIEYVSINKVWKEEPKFSLWLRDHLDYMGEELGIPLDPIDTEVPTNDGFKADIVANSNGIKVVIENQYGKSDHKHLGQLLVYMINLEVKIGIWICENPRNSHENVIDWLNEVSPKDMSFYLIKIKIIKIGENEYMPQFDIISGPNDEFTIIGAKKKEWSDIDFKFYDFWEQFLVKCKKASLFQNRKKTKGHYICSSRGLKEGYMYCVSILRRQKQFSVEIYIDTGEKEINKKEYDELYVKKDLIEDKFGQKLDWKRLDEKRASRIIYRGVGDWIDESNWDNLQERMVNKLIELDKSFRDHISDS